MDPVRDWTIKVDNLDQLLEFIRDNGQCVIYSDADDGLNLIIYDDWLE